MVQEQFGRFRMGPMADAGQDLDAGGGEQAVDFSLVVRTDVIGRAAGQEQGRAPVAMAMGRRLEIQ